MRVITVPLRLRLASATLYLCVPLAVAETIIASRAPWWKLPYASIGVWALAAALIFLPLSEWIARGKPGSFRLGVILASLWTVISAWMSVRMKNPNLGFFSLFLSLYWVAVLLWLRRELARSFFDPRIGWYQSLPKPISGLTCQLKQGEARLELNVSRLDLEGAFVFRDAAPFREWVPRGQRLELLFQFRERQVQCEGVPVRTLGHRFGTGFQFRGMSPDRLKMLGDFVETLRGEGYVQ